MVLLITLTSTYLTRPKFAQLLGSTNEIEWELVDLSLQQGTAGC